MTWGREPKREVGKLAASPTSLPKPKQAIFRDAWLPRCSKQPVSCALDGALTLLFAKWLMSDKRSHDSSLTWLCLTIDLLRIFCQTTTLVKSIAAAQVESSFSLHYS